jgi:hypothetical protein
MQLHQQLRTGSNPWTIGSERFYRWTKAKENSFHDIDASAFMLCCGNIRPQDCAPFFVCLFVCLFIYYYYFAVHLQLNLAVLRVKHIRSLLKRAASHFISLVRWVEGMR